MRNRADFLEQNMKTRGRSAARRKTVCQSKMSIFVYLTFLFFAIVAKEIIEKKLCQKTTYKYRKNRKKKKRI